MLGAEPADPEVAAGLLVGDGGDQQLAARRPPAGSGERGAGRHLGRDLALHVLRAPTANLAADHVAHPGIEAPVLGVGGDRVDVTEQAQRRTLRLAPKPRQQAGAAGLGAEQLAIEARTGERGGEELGRSLLVPGRVDGVDPDQLAEELLGGSAEGGLRLGRDLLHAAEVSDCPPAHQPNAAWTNIAAPLTARTALMVC